MKQEKAQIFSSFVHWNDERAIKPPQCPLVLRFWFLTLFLLKGTSYLEKWVTPYMGQKGIRWAWKILLYQKETKLSMISGSYEKDIGANLKETGQSCDNFVYQSYLSKVV